MKGMQAIYQGRYPPSSSSSWLVAAKDFFQILQSFITTAAIVIGGIWAYYQFWYKREVFPKIEVEHNVFFIKIPEDQCLIMARIIVKNVGQTVVELTNYYTWLQRVFPLDAQIENRLRSGGEIIDKERGYVSSWPLIQERSGEKVTLEPGELDVIYQDFLAKVPIEVVRLSSHFPKPGNNEFWGTASLHTLKEDGRQCT